MSMAIVKYQNINIEVCSEALLWCQKTPWLILMLDVRQRRIRLGRKWLKKDSLGGAETAHKKPTLTCLPAGRYSAACSGVGFIFPNKEGVDLKYFISFIMVPEPACSPRCQHPAKRAGRQVIRCEQRSWVHCLIIII